MRPIANFALTAKPSNETSHEAIHKAASAAIHEWIEQKGAWREDGDGMALQLKDGRTARLETHRLAANATGTIEAWTLTEPIPGGYFETEILLAEGRDETAVVVRQRAGNPHTVLAPFQCDAHSPRFISRIVGNGIAWRCGGSQMRARSKAYLGSAGGAELVAHLRDTSRNVPTIVVSEHDGFLLFPDLDVDLARELSGLALVARIDRDASLRLTRELGAEWSCYNGAIRLYWPGLTALGSPFAHPLWLADRLLDESHNDFRAAGKRLRRTLRRMILELSTSAVAEPALLGAIRAAERAKNDPSDLLALLEQEVAILAAEKKALQQTLQDRDRDVQKLLWQLQRRDAGGRDLDAADTADAAAESAAPPATVLEAVETAMARHRDILVFGADVLKRGVRGLSPDAGPPSKVLAHLDALAEVGRRMARGESLGMRADQWLYQHRNVTSSDDHDAIVCDDGAGARRPFTLHTKPNFNTDPGKCARIYYAFDDDAKRMRIGWVGRHP